ncbi:hypothetical protein [Alteromonas sp. KUL49]|uniref:hypothetical protein n=1 Tax=Alteromonas sp. KUL49 TaxID=2480798 RepID=UPI00102EFD39|nr:hypothetical protein [Alteromonas sp. KUL49]TAP39856.1 hypothetical protein EYS00_11155 [Alteromonas sp. KUL49]GEA11865.1 hypothetical protein KUL49_22400 [Alteromonas sp. KUL49]
MSLQLSEQRYYLHHGHYSHDDGNAFISSDAADIHIQVTEQHTYQYRVNLCFYLLGMNASGFGSLPTIEAHHSVGSVSPCI